MKSLLKAVVKERVIVLFIALIVAAFGLYNYYVIPKQENPHINVNGAIVTTIYPGASPEDVEQLVTKKIEDAASEVSEYDYVSSESGKNVSVVLACYNADADSDKIDKANRELTIGISVALLAFTVGIVIPQLKVAFFPKADKDLMYIDTVVEKVGDLKYTESVADRISRLMLQEPEIVSVTAGIGTFMPRVYLTMDILPDQENCARALVKFDLKKSDRFKTKNELAAYLQEKLDSQIIGATSTVKMMELTGPGNGAVGVRLYGEDPG